MTSHAKHALPFAVLLAAGCAGDGGARGQVDVWALDSAAVLEIGALEGDTLRQLFRVRGVAPLPDGSIAVANGGSHQVRIYDATGAFVRAFGRQGGGPGEFGTLTDVHAVGDTVVAYDRTAARLTRFLADGTYLDGVTLRSGDYLVGIAGVGAGGTTVGWSSSGSPRDGELVRDTVHLLRFAADGSVLDTLGRFPGNERFMRVEGSQGSITQVSILSMPYYRRFLAVSAAGHTYAGATDSAVVHGFAADGAATTLRWFDVPRPLDDAWIEAHAAEVGAASSADPQQVRARTMEAPRPQTLPVFDQLCAGPDGELWIRRFGDPGDEQREWLVLSADGELRATLRLHRDVDIRAVGRERVYTLERDEYDVEYVRGYTLRR